MRYTVHPCGRVDAELRYDPVKELGDMPEFGMLFTLDAQYGVKPREMLANIQRMAEEGTVDYLIIGSDPVGMCLFKLTDASDAWDCVAAGGRLVRCKIDLSFEEYA